jgi:ABC-type multidrug transport system ATPase subunit
MITVENLSKKYGSLTVLSRVSLSISTGEIACLVGPNGSGKSTLIKLVLGLTSPTSGNISFSNPGVSTGYLTELNALPTGYKGNDIIQKLEFLLGDDRSESVLELIRLFGMDEFIHKKVKGFSKGMQKKIGLLVAFSGEPDLVILDEPFEGIDTIDRDKLSVFLKNYVSTGKTVMLSTHILYELDQHCDTAHFLKSGNLVTSFNPKTYSDGTMSANEFTFKNALTGSLETITNPSITDIYRRIYQ